MADEVTKALRTLRAELPKPRAGLSEAEKDELVRSVGPRTARDIVKAQQDFPAARIPFLFSAVDGQAVVDILANDMRGALERALKGKKD